MKTAKIRLADPDFQSQHSGKCNLLIRITGNRLSYAIVDQGNDQLKALFDSHVEGSRAGLDAVMNDDPMLKFHFHKIKVAVETSKFTFIPKEIYSESELGSYAVFAYPTIQSDILVKEIRSARVKNIFAIDKVLNEDLAGRFTNPNIFSQANPLIESALKLYRNHADNLLLLQFNSGSFEALLIKNNNLQYYNIFDINVPDEFNYFLLAIIKDLELKHTDTEVVVSGDIKGNEENYSRIQKYFNRISFADSNKLVQLSDTFQGVPAHRFFSLISLNLCE